MGCHSSIEGTTVKASTVCFLGLDGSGKSHIVHRILHGDSTDYIPISTPASEYYEIPEYDLRLFDVGGLGKYRELWLQIIKQCDGVVFVIDKSDHTRMSRVREEISEVLTECANLSIPILILANKCDLDKTLNENDISSITQISQYHVEYAIKECSAVSGDGIISGRDWILQHIKAKNE
ncbi:small GTP-binding protein, putative [Trichomonas vaginalis G3]|uniref:Small GTP-binding protein, putative n=1 Tax=Trichomonas vaginalis (strain ATCC PRA-98 / G3) TaxID=412133 RepID=A2EYG0_TRIV3|nr:GTP binding [Trichomonas vaginalis G3]EAY02313.1 small GTP-binding protein, putative [Trichomonas vaginalis G3]KAI5500895.1 GTP binding [Trichomonas vaginalis G3]|eukprot:XP_001314628.1 small GTP-binding protein [Trichomonas vaginalis G3]